MSAPRHFFAPGKVVIVGEYAVLDGVPAIVAAVDLGVSLSVAEADVRSVQTPDGDSRFVDAALDAVLAPPGRYVFAQSGGPKLTGKPGLGGSAAATVVATHAGLVLRGLTPTPAEVLAVATEVHHRVQGSGSGVDVAAATLGGMIRFERGHAVESVPRVRTVVVWTGASARTGPRVERYLAWADRDVFVERSRQVVDRFSMDPLGAVVENYELLTEMSKAAGVDYLTPEIERLVNLAEVFSGAGKPSGAGGGDCVIALFVEPDAEARFIGAVQAEGFVVLATRLAPGVAERH